MLMKDARDQIVEYGKEMLRSGLTRGTSGNLSVYDPATGYMAISPSGIGYFETKPEDIVIMTLDGTIVEGNRKPSSEAGMHAGFYRKKPGTCGIVHTHSVFATTFACLLRPIDMIHFCICNIGADKVPCAPAVTFGTPELADIAVQAAGKCKAVLLGNHGLVACGSSLDEAFLLADNIEFAAELQWRAECIGKPNIMSDELLAPTRERFKSYGQ